MKNINLKTIIIVIAVIMAGWQLLKSSNDEKDKVRVCSVEGIEAVLEQVRMIDTTRCRITEVEWREDDKLSDKLRYISVEYADAEGVMFSQDFDLMEPDAPKEPEKLHTWQPASPGIPARQIWPLALSDIDPAGIAAQVQSVIDALPEEMKYRSVERYSITRDTHSGELERKFTILTTKKGEESERKGRHVVTNYYEFEFKVAADGTITQKE